MMKEDHSCEYREVCDSSHWVKSLYFGHLILVVNSFEWREPELEEWRLRLTRGFRLQSFLRSWVEVAKSLLLQDTETFSFSQSNCSVK